MALRCRYSASESNPVEAVHKFPLPERAAICGFRAHIDERVVDGGVEERVRAFEIYDQALIDGEIFEPLRFSRGRRDAFYSAKLTVPAKKMSLAPADRTLAGHGAGLSICSHVLRELEL